MPSQWLVDGLLAQCNAARRSMVEGVLADLMPPLREWPEREVRKLLGPRIGHTDRCSFAYFMLGNAVPPEVIVDWCLAQPGYLRHSESARHLATLILDHKNGRFDGSSGAAAKTCWNVTEKEVKPVYTPHFARDEDPQRIKRYNDKYEVVGVEYLLPGAHYWNAAAARLNQHAGTLPRKGR